MLPDFQLELDCQLITPDDASSWSAYHSIRREVLFEARGRFGVYDPSHPDEHARGNHPKLLLCNGARVGVVRIDLDGSTATLRRVAIRAELQGLGHGRTLLALAETFARSAGCSRLDSNVAPDAVGFYLKCGFSLAAMPPSESPSTTSVPMTKHIMP
jgi:GNAT superfamily N-acetyltransferase